MKHLSSKHSRRTAALIVQTMALISALFVGSGAWAGEADPHNKANEAWITLDGTVESVKPDSFMLDYGDGAILVEMDDGDRDADAYKLLKGDKVTVTGKIDDDFFEFTKIEASSVYVESLGTTFFASAVDEESRETLDAPVIPPVQIARTVVRGTVSNVSGDEFLIDTGERYLRVSVSEMPYDPLDDEGYLKIEQGDRVKVIGQMNITLFEGRELQADSVVKIYRG